jgi:hypothetical protein
MKTTIAALALLASTVAAQADFDLKRSCTFSRFYGLNCTTSYREPTQVDPVQARIDAEERERSIAKWEAFCKPTKQYDSEGVARLVYAAKGCEFGRSE